VRDVRIVVMAKHPAPGHVKTRLAAAVGAERAAALQTAFVLDLAARLAGAGFAATWAYWPPEAPFPSLVPGCATVVQRGADLGARMANAAADVGGPGGAGVVLLGADVPHVDLAAVATACRLVRRGADVVIGPTEDGGYYLLGLRRVRPELFAAMPWGSDTVYAETLARCDALGVRPRLVAPAFDVDEPADLTRLAASIATGAIELPRTREVLARAGLS
jgi:rSAM/selenodomain-associated transferase 1